MMKKSLIAAAVAAAVTAPAAHAVEFELGDDTKFAIEGTVEPAYVSTKDATGDSQSELEDNDSTLQFTGEHAFGAGTTGFFHLEYEYDANEAGGGLNSTDSAWMGLEGGFGMIRTGSYDTLLENNLHELIDPFEYASVSEEADGGEGDQITYMSPSFGGFQVGLEARHQGDGESSNFGGDGGDAGDAGTGVSAVARYSADNWGVVAGTDSRGAVLVDLDGDGDNDEYDDEPTTGFGGWFDIGPVHLAARYATESNRGSNNDVEYAGAGASYSYGPGDIHLVVQDVSPDQGSSFTEVGLGVMHGLYDNLSLFAEVGRFDRRNDAGDVTAVGAIYEF